MNLLLFGWEKAINKKRNGFIYQLQQSCKTPLHEINGNRRSAIQCFIARTRMSWWRMCKRHPDDMSGETPFQRGRRGWEMENVFWVFTSQLLFQSYWLLTPCVVTLIGLRCLFWRQSHDDVMLRGNRKFLPTTIVFGEDALYLGNAYLVCISKKH